MVRTERYIFIAISASLLLHAGLLGVATEKARYPKIYLPPLRRAESTVVIALQPPPPPPPDDMGDRAGVGTASSASAGPTPLQARQADQDQPQLSRDPTGPAKIAHAPNPSNIPPGERGRGGQRGQIAIETPPQRESPVQPALTPPPQTPVVAAVAPPKPAVQPPKPAAERATADQPTAPPEIKPESVSLPKALLLPPDIKLPPPATAPEVQVAVVSPPTPAPRKSTAQVKPQAATGDGLAPGARRPPILTSKATPNPMRSPPSDRRSFTMDGSVSAPVEKSKRFARCCSSPASSIRWARAIHPFS